MISVIGPEGTSEFEAAQAVARALVQLWPNIESTPPEEELVTVAAGVKIAGQRVQDIDVVLCAKFRDGRAFLPAATVRSQDGASFSGKAVAVKNLVVAIEVKDQDATRIRFDGGNVSVQYTRNGRSDWHDATQQNVGQAHSLKEYLRDQYIDLFIHRLVILRGLGKISLPGVLPRSFSGKELITQIALLNGVGVSNGKAFLSSGKSAQVARALSASIFRELRPTALDRKRMDRIAGRKERTAGWSSLLGKKMISMRGRGGCGKTIMLLQSAWRAFDERGARTLFLTYNLALVADVRRSMLLLNIPSTPDQGGIAVDSVMSLILSWLHHLGLAEQDAESALDDYNDNCAAAVALIKDGSITERIVNDLKSKHPDKLDFDFVVVDEAQDWPQAEADLLKFLYGPQQIAVADGVDQLIRGPRCDWFRGVADSVREVVRLRECLRMKANLTIFARTIAAKNGLPWDAEPSADAAGGRIIVVRGEYADRPELHDELMRDAARAGNDPVDQLFCVPPSGVLIRGTDRVSRLGKVFVDRGLNVWDGTRLDVRKDFARNANMLRVVQYASCRGLEGWTVVCDGLDAFWQHKFDTFSCDGADGDAQVSSAKEAWRWAIIPLTRAIDTLVITLWSIDSEFARAILAIAADMRDAVEIRL